MEFVEGYHEVYEGFDIANLVSNTKTAINNNSTFLKCSVKGMKRKTDSDAWKLDTYIQFSLNQDSSFILKDIANVSRFTWSFMSDCFKINQSIKKLKLCQQQILN